MKKVIKLNNSKKPKPKYKGETVFLKKEDLRGKKIISLKLRKSNNAE